jgi:UPF0716 family protein affecting phage T7 exclusion
MPLLLIAFPFLEFWTLLELSARAGALATMGYIVLMMIVGYWLLQWAGRSALMTAGALYVGVSDSRAVICR